jgi:signal transduction histidine kinase
VTGHKAHQLIHKGLDQSPDALGALRICAHVACHTDALGLRGAADAVLDAVLAYGHWPAGALVMHTPAQQSGQAEAVRILATRVIDERTAAQKLVEAGLMDYRQYARDAGSSIGWLIYPLIREDRRPWRHALTIVLLPEEHTPGSTWRTEAIALLDTVAEGVAAALDAALCAERIQAIEEHVRAEEVAIKDELLGTVGHELRGPLTAIQGYSATVLRHEKRLSRAERHQYLEAIEDASSRLALVIDRLLEVSQLAGESARLDCAPVQLGQLAREAVVAARARLQTAQDPAPALHLLAPSASLDGLPAVWGDVRRLRELLNHLLENAIKYSPDGGQITLLLRPARSETLAIARAAGLLEASAASDEHTQHHPMLEIQVRDTGIGIPPEHLERIFERFHRVDTRLTRTVNGLGLGLAICKRITELHGGAIWAQSEPGHGSTFFILLPVAAQT